MRRRKKKKKITLRGFVKGKPFKLKKARKRIRRFEPVGVPYLLKKKIK